MTRLAGLCAVAAVVVSAPAASQHSSASVDPVVTHFREYRDALERNDRPAAETAAAAALAASEAAHRNRTAVLALNLAILRLELGGRYDALRPARAAYELATSVGDSGVDPRLAALTLGRAEIASDSRGADARLLAAIAAAEPDPALADDVYHAAVALGQWALDKQEFVTAESATPIPKRNRRVLE